MKKTFWSVEYAVMGGGKSIKWFENKDDAVKFASADYRDNPVRHTVSKPETIEQYNKLVELTNYEFEQ